MQNETIPRSRLIRVEAFWKISLVVLHQPRWFSASWSASVMYNRTYTVERALPGWIMRSEYSFKRARRGAVVPIPPGKTRITIRIDDDIVSWFRDQVDQAGGGNYQSLMN